MFRDCGIFPNFEIFRDKKIQDYNFYEFLSTLKYFEILEIRVFRTLEFVQVPWDIRMYQFCWSFCKFRKLLFLVFMNFKTCGLFEIVWFFKTWVLRNFEIFGIFFFWYECWWFSSLFLYFWTESNHFIGDKNVFKIFLSPYDPLWAPYEHL